MRPCIMSKRTGTRQSCPVDSEVRYCGKNGQTVLAILQKTAKIETIPFKIGIYVASINGIPGNSSEGWVFKINGKSIPESADSVETFKQDRIEWHFVRTNPEML